MVGIPAFDENAGIHLLRDVPVTPETIEALQNCTLAVMTDLYDRKVERAYFMQNIGRCISFYTALSKLYIADQVVGIMNTPEGLKLDNMVQSRDWFLGNATKKQAEVLAILSELTQIAEDPKEVN